MAHRPTCPATSCCAGRSPRPAKRPGSTDGGAAPDPREEGIQLNIEPHPEDFAETLQPAVDMIRVINSKNAFYRAPHTFYFGDDIQAMIREAAPRWRTCNRRHVQSQGLLGPPPSSTARLEGDGAPASQYRPGRGRLGRVLRHTARGPLRRHHDRVRLPGREVEESRHARDQRYIDKYWDASR